MSSTLDQAALRAGSVVWPGLMAQEAMLRQHMTSNKFAELLGISLDDLTQFFDGNYRIDRAFAAKLMEVTGVSISYWLAFERQYHHRLDKMREKADKERA